jgi:hypothetical protein
MHVAVACRSPVSGCHASWILGAALDAEAVAAARSCVVVDLPRRGRRFGLGVWGHGALEFEFFTPFG